ncbi:IS1182 family transposase, partial [Lacticaseibacillus nasuensis]|uniref:IS1182 family transposase n=1 Tax=Lacticaseibacillus nasuensis TaxID=944671 RepID=UPI0022462EAA
MRNQYNMNQTSLSIATEFIPENNHEVRYINDLVESMDYQVLYTTGRPREYDLRAMMKLVLFSYLRGRTTCRLIEREAKENIYARWLIQEHVPSYRTIARFIVSDDAEQLIESSFESMRRFLVSHGLIDDAVFIDGTKILANANKYSFVWKKNVIRFDELNREKAQALIQEMKDVEAVAHADSLPMDYEELDLTVAKLEERVDELNKAVEVTKRVSPNPAKQARRKAKSYLHKATQIRAKRDEYAADKITFGERNSFSKTDHDATFMRVKEDPMMNGQLKPGYNLQIATNHQFVLDYQLFWNPTDTRTLIPFLQTLSCHQALGQFIVADAGYGSEANYRYIADELPDQIALIPYGTMLKENSRKWSTDDRKVMNWEYHDKDKYFVDPEGVRFNFLKYVTRKDQYGFTREFHRYQAEAIDENQHRIDQAFTPGGRVRYIDINPDWEYFKAKTREQLSTEIGASIYARRKIDVESVFGHLKAYLGFTRFTVRGKNQVKKQMGFALMAMNIGKLASQLQISLSSFRKRKATAGNLRDFRSWPYLIWGFVTAP